VKFRATLILGGKTATGIEVPREVVESLGSSKKPAVTVKLGTHTYRSTVATMAGRFMLPVSAEVRQAAGVAAGDEVEVELQLDSQPRELVVPDDLSQALDAEPAARAFFEELSYSNRRRFVLSIEDARTPETRQRRIEKSVTSLREGKV
jgi:hypothetical protein